MEQLLRRVPRPLRALAAFGAMQLPLGLPGRKWLVECGADWERQLPLVSPTRFLPAERRALVRRAGFRGGEAEALYQERAPTTGDLLRRLTQADFESYLPEDILVKVDRASMLSSLEMRAPMLDHRIVELAFARTPTRLKAGAKTRKLLLKTLTQRLLPPEFDRERKQGFIVPLDNWMRSPLWQDRVRELLVEGTEGFFEPRFVSRLLAYQRRGLANGHRLFALLVLEMWRKQYGVAI
jgi:asparagine synthase (glutamine-hydrolysing)